MKTHITYSNEEDIQRIRTGGIKFKLLVPFLSIDFLKYLAESEANVKIAFDVTPNACSTLQREAVKELQRYNISSERPYIKKLLSII